MLLVDIQVFTFRYEGCLIFNMFDNCVLHFVNIVVSIQFNNLLSKSCAIIVFLQRTLCAYYCLIHGFDYFVYTGMLDFSFNC